MSTNTTDKPWCWRDRAPAGHHAAKAQKQPNGVYAGVCMAKDCRWSYSMAAGTESPAAEFARAAQRHVQEERAKADDLHLKLKGAREKLCAVQMLVPAHWRTDIGTAIHIIDEVGSTVCDPTWKWSVDNQPEYPADDGA